MALIKCPACERDISAQALTCPHCGHPIASRSQAGAQKKSHTAAVGCLVIILVIVSIIFIGAGNESNKSPPSPCASDWIQCADNAELVNNYSKYYEVQSACKREATDQARYGTPSWPWIPFGTFLKGTDYVTSGKVTAIESDAQFQNGFGAMVHSRVTCSYDLRAHKVLWVTIGER